ncbi:hypothetical protein CYMTET_17718 [Cymbomonas tetramitiformis]|uniref:Uncharacterized protein n=1 Tax=Cymbomonas tetramitiformis TaxID=36881 RepID=A0AAE0L6P3_9CHLO|nr:hypothetical protein CYMTET_17718 [Cymbomonas tetramitiformis]
MQPHFDKAGVTKGNCLEDCVDSLLRANDDADAQVDFSSVDMAWISASKEIINTTTPLDNDDVWTDKRHLNHMRDLLRNVKFNKSTQRLRHLAVQFKIFPMLIAFTVTSSFLHQYAYPITQWFNHKATIVETLQDFHAHFKSPETQLQGLFVIHKHVMSEEYKKFHPSWLDSCSSEALSYANEELAALSTTRAEEIIRGVQGLSGHASGVIGSGGGSDSDFIDIIDDEQAYTQAIANVVTFFKRADFILTSTDGRPTDSSDAAREREMVTSLLSAARTFVESGPPRSMGTLLKIERDLGDIVQHLCTFLKHRSAGITFDVTDGDGIEVTLQGQRLIFRLALIDAFEHNQAWLGVISKLLLRAWKRMGYLLTVDKYFFPMTDLFNGEVQTRHVVVVRFTSPTDPSDTFLPHEELVSLGAARLYLNYMFCESIQEIYRLYALQTRAIELSIDRRNSITGGRTAIPTHGSGSESGGSAGGSGNLYSDLHETYRAPDVYRQLLDANKGCVLRAEAVLDALCIYECAWREMEASFQPDLESSVEWSRISRQTNKSEWMQRGFSVWVVPTYMEPVEFTILDAAKQGAKNTKGESESMTAVARSGARRAAGAAAAVSMHRNHNSSCPLPERQLRAQSIATKVGNIAARAHFVTCEY